MTGIPSPVFAETSKYEIPLVSAHFRALFRDIWEE